MKQNFDLSHMLTRSGFGFILIILLIGGLTSCGTTTRQYVIQRPLQTHTSQKLDINSAEVAELEAVPGIGKALAYRIVAHREKHGKFRLTEHLLMVHGISERKFKQISSALTAE